MEILEPIERKVDKASAIAEKLNKMTARFSEKINDAQELIVTADELNIDTGKVIQEIKDLPTTDQSFNLDLLPQILNLENMMKDVMYIRETLYENSEIGKRLLKVISAEIEFEPNAELLASYSQLSETLTSNMQLFLACYRDISKILINISNLTHQNIPDDVKNVQVNNIQINNAKVKSTAELIKQLSMLKDNHE